MKTEQGLASSELQDWPLTAADHKIDSVKAQELINAYAVNGYGAYFTLATINGLITPANAGIRYYFTIYNDILTVMLSGVQKIAIGNYDDLHDAKLEISIGLNILPPTANQRITLTDAATANRSYRDSANFLDGRKGGMFGIEAILAITMQAGCAGIRFYFAKDTQGIKTIVLYGVDSEGQNLNTYIGDQNAPCPNYCSTINPLNS